MKKVRIFIYNDREVTAQDIADMKHASLGPIWKLLNGIESGSDVTELVDNYVSREDRCTFIYRDVKVARPDIIKITGLTRSGVDYILKGVEPGTDITDVIDKRGRRIEAKKYYVHDALLSRAEISKIYNINAATVSTNTRGIESGTDISDIVDRLASRPSSWYIVFDEKMSIAEATSRYNLGRGVLRGRIHRAGIKPGGDISELVGATKWQAKDVKRKKLSEIVGDTSVGETGVELTYKNVIMFMGSGDVTNSKLVTPEFLMSRNYEGRKALGFDRACRSKWLTDDLWEYTCPVCGKKLVLTTAQIVAHEHGSMCEDSVEDLLNGKGSYVFIQK